MGVMPSRLRTERSSQQTKVAAHIFAVGSFVLKRAGRHERIIPVCDIDEPQLLEPCRRRIVRVDTAWATDNRVSANYCAGKVIAQRYAAISNNPVLILCDDVVRKDKSGGWLAVSSNDIAAMKAGVVIKDQPVNSVNKQQRLSPDLLKQVVGDANVFLPVRARGRLVVATEKIHAAVAVANDIINEAHILHGGVRVGSGREHDPGSRLRVGPAVLEKIPIDSHTAPVLELE